MRSFLLGLLASTVMAYTPAEDLEACGNAFYVPSQYTCYSGDKLCPVINGQATQPCGEDCYLESAYSCNDGVLAAPTPSIDGTFLVVALQSSSAGSSFVQAAGLVFRIGGDASTYCPSEVTDCPIGTETVWTCANDTCSLNVEVPGGQYIYVAPNGAVSYTQAHSGVTPDGSQTTGFSVSGGVIQFGGQGFLACPPQDSSDYYQLYAGSLVTDIDDACYSITLSTALGNDPGFSAWQYT